MGRHHPHVEAVALRMAHASALSSQKQPSTYVSHDTDLSLGQAGRWERVEGLENAGGAAGRGDPCPVLHRDGSIELTCAPASPPEPASPVPHPHPAPGQKAEGAQSPQAGCPPPPATPPRPPLLLPSVAVPPSGGQLETYFSDMT